MVDLKHDVIAFKTIATTHGVLYTDFEQATLGNTSCDSQNFVNISCQKMMERYAWCYVEEMS